MNQLARFRAGLSVAVCETLKNVRALTGFGMRALPPHANASTLRTVTYVEVL